MDGIKKKLSSVLEKIKSIKHVEVIVAVLAVALMIIVFTGFKGKNTAKSTETKDISTGSVAEQRDTVEVWEKKLAAILSGIEGVGKAEVMITAKSTTEKITANTSSVSTTVSGGGTNSTTSTTTAPVIVNNSGTSEPYIVKELMPEIMGVIVVAEGADNAITKLSIMRAVQTALNVDASCVEIYPMK